jgi:hypothetical protein
MRSEGLNADYENIRIWSIGFLAAVTVDGHEIGLIEGVPRTGHAAFSTQARLFKGNRAYFMATAGPAEAPLPQGVEVLEDRIDEDRRMGPNADLKVAFALSLCA